MSISRARADPWLGVPGLKPGTRAGNRKLRDRSRRRSPRIQGRNLRLFGIFIPDTGRVCGRTRPSCGSRAAIALDALLEGRGFVRCRLMGAGTAICYVPFIGHPGDRDLATHLLVKGLAVASPDAPQRYRAVERWARRCGIGIWGRFRSGEPAPSGARALPPRPIKRNTGGLKQECLGSQDPTGKVTWPGRSPSAP